MAGLFGGRSGGYGTVVSARDLSVDYAATTARSRYVAVRGVSFDLFAGEVLGLVGDAGSGKSTLVGCIAGVVDRSARHRDRPQAVGGAPHISGGELTVFDRNVRSRPLSRRLSRKIGYLAQDGANDLDSRLTVAENISEPIFLRDHRADVGDAVKTAAILVDAVHLSLSTLEKRPWELSSGQRQRVALARSLALDPELLIADEPIRGVDLASRENVLAVIPELQAARRLTAIVVSSDLGVVRSIGARIAVLSQGIIVGIGSLDELIARPEHPYLKALAQAVDGGVARVPSNLPHTDRV